MDKYRKKYRIASARAQWWDYGQTGAYFITICTANREHYFGEINNGTMQLNHVGIIADLIWHEIPNHHPIVELGDFVVMPNHIHGILILNNGSDGDNDDNGANVTVVETRHVLSLPSEPPPQQPEPPKPESPSIGQQRFQNQGKNTVSSIIGSYKSAVTKHANRLGLKNGWQPRFHDHIIRNEEEYHRIATYIINNPGNWQQDKFF